MIVSDVEPPMLTPASALAKVMASRSVHVSAAPFEQRMPSSVSVVVPVLSAVVFT